ncbi:hypothetical protein R1sor_006091 [Riccia sorocarpa]|uniref:Uncharacterized protein n=1 Tax=Riccia sorocarpa TaxID=122646 RepID=A0ABD3HQ94_9MARC
MGPTGTMSIKGEERTVCTEAQQTKPGQIASIRPAGTVTGIQNIHAGTQNQQMDYRAALLPVKHSDIGNKQLLYNGSQNIPIGYSTAGSIEQAFQTPAATQEASMEDSQDDDTEEALQAGAKGEQKLNPQEADTCTDGNNLLVIVEAKEDEGEASDNERKYITMHQTWMDVLDENLKKNPS